MSALVWPDGLSLLQFRIGLRARRRSLGVGNDFVFLDAAHHIHNSFVDLPKISRGQRPGAGALYVGDHLALAVGLINGQAGIALQPSNFDDSGSALVHQGRQFAVQFVDFLAPIGNVHRKLLAVSSWLLAHASEILTGRRTTFASYQGIALAMPKVLRRQTPL